MPGTTVTASTTILSAWANGFTADVAATFNTEWPISLLPTISVAKGGTGATTAALARDNLGLTIGTNVSGVLPGYLYGLTLSNNVADATNDIDITTGTAVDSTAANVMALASALTKRLDAAWVVGTNQGGLDTGAIADTTYHVYLIKRVDTGVVDAIFSASASAPTLPTNYTLYRRIGSVVRAGGTIRPFIQDGDLFMWGVPIRNVAATNPGTSAVTRSLTLPVGIRVRAKIFVYYGASAAADMPANIYISDLSVADTGPGIASGAGTLLAYNVATFINNIGAVADVMTNTSGQVRSRVEVSAAGTILYISTLGWIDARGRT